MSQLLPDAATEPNTEQPYTEHGGAEMSQLLPDAATEPTVTVERAAAVLGIGRSLAYELARTGRLPTLRLRKRIVVPTAQLLRLLDADE